MEKTAYVSGNPFKVIKMMNGEDVLCKVLEEYKDALVVEYPMAVVKNQIVERENHIVEHTGLQRWMNFTHDKSFLILKEKILTLGDLAPEVTLYYKHICKRMTIEESNEPTDEEEAMMKLRDNMESLVEALDDTDGDSNLPSSVFPLDKSKLH
ncbi:uncharacterized protein METZ01_LOCUS341022 [marine metagenome]|uniref:Sm-like domain-containing protein n=1 Tax=marine metagenome TaxID=408172 RepID=A0A382QTD9_9ZZZZ